MLDELEYKREMELFNKNLDRAKFLSIIEQIKIYKSVETSIGYWCWAADER